MNKTHTPQDGYNDHANAIINLLCLWEALSLTLKGTIWALLDVEERLGLHVTNKQKITDLCKMINGLSKEQFGAEAKKTKKLMDACKRIQSQDKITIHSGEELTLPEFRNSLAHILYPTVSEANLLKVRKILVGAETQIKSQEFTVEDIRSAYKHIKILHDHFHELLRTVFPDYTFSWLYEELTKKETIGS